MSDARRIKPAGWAKVQMDTLFEIHARAREHKRHRKRVKKSKSEIDKNKPLGFPMSSNDNAKQSFTNTEYSKIKHENAKILKRLFNLVKEPSRFTAEKNKGPRKSMTLTSRAKFYEKIEKENRRLAKSLYQAKPILNSREWKSAYDVHSEHVRQRAKRFKQRFRKPPPPAVNKSKSRLGTIIKRKDGVKSASPPNVTIRKDINKGTQGHKDTLVLKIKKERRKSAEPVCVTVPGVREEKTMVKEQTKTSVTKMPKEEQKIEEPVCEQRYEKKEELKPIPEKKPKAKVLLTPNSLAESIPKSEAVEEEKDTTEDFEKEAEWEEKEKELAKALKKRRSQTKRIIKLSSDSFEY